MATEQDKLLLQQNNTGATTATQTQTATQPQQSNAVTGLQAGNTNATAQPQNATQPQQAQSAMPSAAASLANMKGISDNTKQALGQLTANGYQPSEAVNNALNELNRVISTQPAAFQSQHSAQLSQIMNQILGRGQFQYDFASDPMYQSYRDQYMQQGRQAMMDTMGNAARLTGGYGNSYANTAGNQAYQQYLTQLNDRIPELYNMARQGWQDEGDRLAQNYSMLNDAYNNEYGRWQDEYNRWANERSYWGDQYNNERNFDYSDYQNQLNYWQNLANAENSQWNADRDYYHSYAMNMIQKGLVPSADILAAAGISTADAQALAKKYKKGGSSGSSKSSGSKNYSTSPAPTSTGDTVTSAVSQALLDAINEKYKQNVMKTTINSNKGAYNSSIYSATR